MIRPTFVWRFSSLIRFSKLIIVQLACNKFLSVKLAKQTFISITYFLLQAICQSETVKNPFELQQKIRIFHAEQKIYILKNRNIFACKRKELCAYFPTKEWILYKRKKMEIFHAKEVFSQKINNTVLSKGEICVAVFSRPCEWCELRNVMKANWAIYRRLYICYMSIY